MAKELNILYKKFSHQSDCLAYIASIRWGNTPTCPKCGSPKHSPVKGKTAYRCNFCNRTFTATTNTVFHKSKVDLQKWFYSIIVELNPLRKMTARGLAEKISVTKDTAWAIQRKIKNALITAPQLILEIDRNLNQELYGI